MPLHLPSLGLGTWGMGGKYERDPRNASQSVETIKRALAVGYRLIDTAELYGQGLAEEIVGKAMGGFPREELCLVSKVWTEHLLYNDVLEACEGSLHRLKTNYLDVYLVHYPSSTVPMAETMRAMETLLESGKIRAIGVSNFSVAYMEEAHTYLKNTTIAVNQIEYNLLNQSAATDVIPYCHEHKITVMAYRPLAKGKLPGERSVILDELSKQYQKTPAQIALNWLMAKGTVPIPKAGSIEHLEENWGALGWELKPHDVAQLTTV